MLSHESTYLFSTSTTDAVGTGIPFDPYQAVAVESIEAVGIGITPENSLIVTKQF